MGIKYHILAILIILALGLGLTLIVKFPILLLALVIGTFVSMFYYVAYMMVRSYFED